MKVRIQKYLSQNHILSRRKAEEYLLKGWIFVNGQVVTQLGFAIDPDIDIVTLHPSVSHIQTQHRYIAFHKPRGIVSNCPQDNETQITDLLPASLQHLNTLGRLDKESEGLILLTDDGVFAKHVMSQEHEREYEVWLNAPLTQEKVKELEKGIVLFGKKTLPLTISRITPTQCTLRMREGKNRHIRRIMEWALLRVTRLKRYKVGAVSLGNLEKGAYRNLSEEEYLSFGMTIKKENTP